VKLHLNRSKGLSNTCARWRRFLTRGYLDSQVSLYLSWHSQSLLVHWVVVASRLSPLLFGRSVAYDACQFRRTQVILALQPTVATALKRAPLVAQAGPAVAAGLLPLVDRLSVIAAEILGRVVLTLRHSSGAPRTVRPFPAPASSTGRCYYVLRAHHSVVPCVAAGADTAIRLLGGSWIEQGQAPRGFATLEEALNDFAGREDTRAAVIHW
jgi:hypothetical protein